MRTTAALLVLTAALLAPACSSSTDTPAPVSDADAIVVSHDASSVSVENKLAVRLLGVRVELSAPESPQPFVLVIPSIEKGAKADAQLSSFKTESADVLVDPSAVHPTQITIKARDTFGKPHETTVAWVP